MTEQTITIFLADDHTMFREGLAALVAREDRIRVVGQCGDGLKVFEQVRQLQPDVVVLDISMSGLNGLDICSEITRKAQGVSVLILTMHDNEELIAKALERGASGYLLKESAGDELIEAIWAVARGELYLGPGIPKGVLRRLGKGDSDPYDQLTIREREILHLIAEGKTNRRIACDLSLSIKTVNTHRMHLMHKLEIHDVTSLVKYALRKGIVPLH
jgi:DNA-binding NarL/FixJ family response regulator